MPSSAMPRMPAWSGDIEQVVLRGSFYLTEIVFFHVVSRSVLFADAIQNFPRDWFTGWRGVLSRLGGIVAPNPGMPTDWRATFLRRGTARLALGRILDWPIERVVFAHGDLPAGDGAAFVRRAFDWLLPDRIVFPRGLRGGIRRRCRNFPKSRR